MFKEELHQLGLDSPIDLVDYQKIVMSILFDVLLKIHLCCFDLISSKSVTSYKDLCNIPNCYLTSTSNTDGF